MITNLFILKWYHTDSDNKYDSERHPLVMGDRDSIFTLWFVLKQKGEKHLEITNIHGQVQKPEQGLDGLVA